MELGRDEIIKKGAIILVFAAPFLNGYIEFVFHTNIISNLKFACMILLVVLAIVIIWFFQEKLNLKAINNKYFILCSVFYFGVVIIGIVSALINNSPLVALKEILIVIFEMSIMFVLTVLIDQKEANCEFALSTYEMIGLIVAILSCLEIISGFALCGSRYENATFYEGYAFHPATSIFTNENDLAAFELTACVIIMYKIVNAVNREFLYKRTAMLLLVLLPITVTDSTIFRIGIFITYVFVIGFLLFGKTNSKYKIEKATILTIIVIVISVFLREEIRKIFFMLSCVYEGKKYVGIPTVGASILGQLTDKSLGTVTIRKNLFIFGIKESTKNPLVGFGPKSFSKVISENSYYLRNTGGITDPHNYIIELLVEYGYIIALLFILICVVIFVVNMRLAVRTDNVNVVIASLLLLITFCISSIMPSAFLESYYLHYALFLSLIGFSCSKKRFYPLT